MVTGGTGFIGAHVVDRLVRAGHSVTLFARDPTKVAAFVDHPRIRFVEGSLTDDDAMRRALDGQDTCVHIALGWGDTPIDMALQDTLPAIRLMHEATEAGVERFLYTSSIAAFGGGRRLYDDDTALLPDTTYGATKAATEAYLFAIATESTMHADVIRPGYTFGAPAVDGAALYSDQTFRTMVEHAVAGTPIEVTRGAGTQFIWAGDLAEVYVRMLERDGNRRVVTAVSRDFTSWEEIARLVVARAGTSSEIIVADSDLDPTIGRNDVSAMERELDLRFRSRPRLDEHVAYLVDRARRD